MVLNESTERNIYKALAALRRRGIEGKSFVIVEHSPPVKFVQFGIGPVLRMDVPVVSLSTPEAERAYDFFRELGGAEVREYDAPNPHTGRIQHGATSRLILGMTCVWLFERPFCLARRALA